MSSEWSAYADDLSFRLRAVYSYKRITPEQHVALRREHGGDEAIINALGGMTPNYVDFGDLESIEAYNTRTEKEKAHDQ